MKKICENCAFCKQVFVRAGYSLHPFPYFLCTLRQELITLADGCGNRREKTAEYDLSLSRFQRAEADIKAIRKNV